MHGKEREGAYSVKDEKGEQVLYMFEESDDAMRYAMQLEDQDYPEMHVIEVEPEMMMGVCEDHGYEYTVITRNDIVIPPLSKHDII